MWRILAIFIILLFLMATDVQAVYDPLSAPNNRYGIHIIDENDLEDAARLVNSANGDWGYVTLVIREDDRKLEKWQAIFDKMRTLHLIPLVRLATRVENSVWVKPRVDDIGSWVDFLNSLNWVIENRYVIVFNEPNHAKEWGGEINPEEYTWYLKEFSRRLKASSTDFFILPAGLDASAANSFNTLDETQFIGRMVAKEPDVLQFIDGWTSHSYPNPDFSGSPLATGRGTIATFKWERQLLAQYGINSLPIFITETGWKHSQGKQFQANYPAVETVARYFETAFSSTWQDGQIAAVVPFLLNYQDEPFDHFSLKKIGDNGFYPMFETITALGKAVGAPKQKISAEVLSTNFPSVLVTNSTYTFSVELENTGQAMMSSEDNWQLSLDGLPDTFEVIIGNLPGTLPFQRTRVDIHLKTSRLVGIYAFQLSLKYKGQPVVTAQMQLTLVPPPSLYLEAKTWINRLAEGDDFILSINDEDGQLLQSVNPVFSEGFANVENLYNIVPNKKYGLVLTKPYYLPRQLEAILSESKTAVVFPTLMPFDPSNDGQLSIEDLNAFWQRPLETIGLLLAL